MLPNLIIIGAAKAGTTALHSYLDLHPEIVMSLPKELDFWQEADCLDRLADYERHFSSGARIRGESSPRYSMDPIWSGAPGRLHAAIPDIRLVYLVRDPVSRAFLHHTQRRDVELDDRTYAEAFRDLDDPLNHNMAASRYAHQLEKYLEYFPASNILVVDHRDLLEHRRTTLRHILEYVGVDPNFDSPALDRRHNVTQGKRQLSRLHLRLAESAVGGLSRKLPRGIRNRALPPIRRVVSPRRLPPPEPIPPELRERVGQVLKPDADRFRALTGRPFEHWSI